jgi:hypothetical protein
MYRAKGLSTYSFFFGVINVFVIGFVLGKWPEHYWVFNLLKCFFYLGFIWYQRLRKPRDLLSMIEICWIVCHSYMIFTAINLLDHHGYIKKPKLMEDYCEESFKIYWGFANGMLGGALIMLGNAMIFHDLPNLASCFIHLTPCSVTWTMRWFGPEINKAYPGVFCLPGPEKTTDSFDDILFPALKFYFIWLAVYSLYMIPYGIHLGSSDEAVKNG